MELMFWLRILNIGLSLFVAILCFAKLIWNDADKPRRARIIALGLISASIAIGSYELRYDEPSIRVPLATVAMGFAAYGMKNMSNEPEQYRRRII